MRARQEARGWLVIGVGSLVLAGIFSIILVVGRLPGLSDWIKDPLFARRCLAVHVNLAMVVWLLGSIAALLVVSTGSYGSRLLGLLPWLAGLGVGALVWSATIRGVRPVLSNYIPALDHPLFLGGLLIFGLAVAGVFLGRMGLDSRARRSQPLKSTPELFFAEDEGERESWFPEQARIGLRAAGVALLMALLTVLGSWWTTPATLELRTYYELLFWGGGHVLQVATVAGMVSVWMMLLHRVLGRVPVSRRLTTILFTILVLPTLLAPWWAFQGTISSPYYPRFTALMRWGIFPVVSVFLLFSIGALFSAGRRGELSGKWFSSPYLLGFLASAGLTVLGFVLGAMIRGSSTLIPAHYHAAIGGVTVSYMTGTYLVLNSLGWRFTTQRRKRLAVHQPLIFGVGQIVFAIGFGSAGLGRKTYGSEQHIRTLGETIGMGAMGLGGLIAVVGGLLFLTLVGMAWYSQEEQTTQRERKKDVRETRAHLTRARAREAPSNSKTHG